MPDRITAEHLKQAAIVYVRPFSPEQVCNHTESTRIQVGLREKAVGFDWPNPVTILDDLGLSAGGARSGGGGDVEVGLRWSSSRRGWRWFGRQTKPLQDWTDDLRGGDGTAMRRRGAPNVGQVRTSPVREVQYERRFLELDALARPACGGWCV